MFRSSRWTTLLIAALAFSARVAPAADEQPNFIIAIVDDLGYGDLGCYGHKASKTPNLDRLSGEGLRLTHCYSACAVCSPSRTGLLTGRTPYRVGIHAHIPWASPMHVGRNEITIATLLRNAGYATCQVGKWHMNGMFNSPEQPQPNEHGFDHWFATQNNALPNHRNPFNFVRNGREVGTLEGYSSALVVDEAIRWLESRPADKPFFLYVAFHEPHEPIATDPQYAKLFPHEDPRYSAYYGNIAQMDANMGRLLRQVDKLGLRDNTFVLFTSDNGPARTGYHPYGSTAGLRENKGHVYEGGIRVPGIIRWPGRVAVGESAEPVCGVDLLPTICEIVGIPQPADRAIDGTSLMPLFAGKKLERRTPLYWQYSRALSPPKVVLRDGDMKVAAQVDQPWESRTSDIKAGDMRRLKEAKLIKFEVYNLRDDPTEQHDLAAGGAEKYADLIAKLEKLYAEVIAESPVWPEFVTPPYERDRIVYPDLGVPRGTPPVKES